MELITSQNYIHNHHFPPKWNFNSNSIQRKINKKLAFSNPIQKKLRVSNFAAINRSNSSNNSTVTKMSSTETTAIAAGNVKLSASIGGGDSNTALEQLDFERGVCIPFRKYTPQTVRNSFVLVNFFEK